MIDFAPENSKNLENGMEDEMEGIQYLVDEAGERTAVVIPVKGNEPALEEFLEDLYGRRIIRERASDEVLSKEQFLTGLR